MVSMTSLELKLNFLIFLYIIDISPETSGKLYNPKRTVGSPADCMHACYVIDYLYIPVIIIIYRSLESKRTS